jgi:hypothetical protein
MNNVPDKVRDYLDTGLSLITIKEYELAFTEVYEEVQNFSVDIAKEINKFYNGPYHIQELYNIIAEPVKNTNIHGGNGKSHINKVEIFLAPKRFVASFWDGGEFYKRDDIKQKYEKKIHPNEWHDNHNFPTFHAGTEIIFKGSEFIYVDTVAGKLYLGKDAPIKQTL